MTRTAALALCALLALAACTRQQRATDSRTALNTCFGVITLVVRNQAPYDVDVVAYRSGQSEIVGIAQPGRTQFSVQGPVSRFSWRVSRPLQTRRPRAADRVLFDTFCDP